MIEPNEPTPEPAPEHQEPLADAAEPSGPASNVQEDVEALRAALAEREEQLASERETSRRLVARVREALLASDPDVAPELVQGETLEEIEESFAQAQAVVRRVRERVARETPFAAPAGAPGRLVHTPATALDKIRAGLAGR